VYAHVYVNAHACRVHKKSKMCTFNTCAIECWCLSHKRTKEGSQLVNVVSRFVFRQQNMLQGPYDSMHVTHSTLHILIDFVFFVFKIKHRAAGTLSLMQTRPLCVRMYALTFLVAWKAACIPCYHGSMHRHWTSRSSHRCQFLSALFY
jgi:hypothetical protein